MTNLFKHESYATQRPKVLSGYVDQQVAYLETLYPDKDPEAIRAFVKKTVIARCSDPVIEILRHPSPGNTIREKIPLSHHITQNIGQDIITPSGSVYVVPTKKASFLKMSLKKKLKERKIYKTKMLQALEAGDTILANNNNKMQASTKIFSNSAPGAMQSPHNILYDKPGYNATTSIARHSVRYGYAHTERLVEGNLYITCYDDAVAYCMRLKLVEPANVLDVCARYGISVPSIDDVAKYLLTSLSYYTLYPPKDQIYRLITMMHPSTRTFIFYASCLKNLLKHNDAVFRAFLNTLFRIDHEIDPQDNPEDVFKFETDLMAMITSLNYELLGRDESGERYNLDDAVKDYPDGVRHIMAIARHMETVLGEFGELLTMFFRIEADIARLIDHPKMVRKAVVVSDTDSVIFSTQSMVEWYCGQVTFDRSSYEINAFTVYVISQSLEHIFARLSCGFGMVGEDISLIKMKNEFLYPIFLRTASRKHYVGIVQMQEGKLLPKLKTDIKGLGFRSSTLPSITNKTAEKFIVDIMNNIMKQGTISASDVLTEVANFENYVFTSLLEGSREFLQTVSVNAEGQYDDPDITAHYYYKFWQSVFVPTFDPIILPNKCFKIPLIAKGKILKHEDFSKSLKAFDEKCYYRFQKFMETSTRNLSYILIPPTMGTIPDIFRPLIDVRSIIYQNCGPFSLGLESMGFAYSYSHNKFLINDYFGNHVRPIPFNL